MGVKNRAVLYLYSLIITQTLNQSKIAWRTKNSSKQGGWSEDLLAKVFKMTARWSPMSSCERSIKWMRHLDPTHFRRKDPLTKSSMRRTTRACAFRWPPKTPIQVTRQTLECVIECAVMCAKLKVAMASHILTCKTRPSSASMRALR